MVVGLPVAPEKEVQKAALQYLTTVKRYFCWRNNTGGFRDKRDHFYQFGKIGSGDVLGLTSEGIFFSIEFKRRGALPTPKQIEFMKSVNASNGISFVAYTLDDVIENLP